jgi:hypothetical protein
MKSKRVLNIKLNFINNYIDATNLKKAHLNDNCGERLNTTSKCNIKNWLDAINNKSDKNNNHTINSIKNEYNKILNIHNIKNININNSYIECCFIINKTYNLFTDYVNMLLYCLKLIELKPYLIRDHINYLFDLETNDTKKYFYQDNDSIYINHMNTILNTTVQQTNNQIDMQKGTFIFFSKPRQSKKNDVYFI